ncbi:MAG: hypothetical protein ABIL20_00850 [candidate division WOR-3 bacterium]
MRRRKNECLKEWLIGWGWDAGIKQMPESPKLVVIKIRMPKYLKMEMPKYLRNKDVVSLRLQYRSDTKVGTRRINAFASRIETSRW